MKSVNAYIFAKCRNPNCRSVVPLNMKRGGSATNVELRVGQTHWLPGSAENGQVANALETVEVANTIVAGAKV
jgi:hypothetical protein